MIRELITQGVTAQPVMMSQSEISTMPQQQPHPHMQYSMASGRFRPPQPNMGLDGEVTQGYSYKLAQNLEVADRDGKTGLGDNQTRYDVAFLQLQLQEAIEINKRKDEELAARNLETEALYKRVRDYLLVQD
jgi:translation initiation factor 2 beta subunit (eIF-2beta)/eIF-5